MCSGMFTSVVILALRASESAQHVPITYMNGASRTRTGDLLVARHQAGVGGWKTPRTLVEIYQRPDSATMYRVVSEGTTIVEELA